MTTIRVAYARDAAGIAYVQVTTSQVPYQKIFPAEMLASQSVAKREEIRKEILTDGKTVVGDGSRTIGASSSRRLQPTPCQPPALAGGIGVHSHSLVSRL